MNCKPFIISLILATAVLAADPTFLITEEIESLGCYIYSDFSFYDLRPLQNVDGDYQVTNSETQSTYTFNFCQYTSNPCGDADIETFAYRQPVSGDSCFIQVSSDIYPQEVNSTAELEDANDGIHISLTYGGGDLCNDEPSTITYEILCDKTIVGSPQSLYFGNSDKCNPEIVFSHSAGCPVASANAFFAYLDEHPWVVGTILIVIGVIITFYGAKFLPWVVGLIAGLAVFTVVMLICSAIGWLDYIDPTMADEEGSLGLTIVSFLLAIICGAGVGALFKIFFFYGFVLLGFILGFLGGYAIYALLLMWADSVVLLYILEFGIALVGAYLCFAFKDGLAIITTSAIGAYASIKGIAQFAGGYPDELLLYTEIMNGTASWELSYLLYVAGMVLLCLIGVFVQSKMHKEAAEDHFKSV